MTVTQDNQLRAWAVRRARSYKELFLGAVLPKRALYAWLFRGENGDLRWVGEHVLADLRGFTKSEQLEIFHTDAQVLAYRLGKQAVFRRITYFLNLDEAQVQQLMEIDDGYGDGY